jgi:hypothetical protein
MTRFFVLAYERSLGRLLELHEFDQERSAFSRRMELDLKYRPDADVEVSLLSAQTLEELKKTHSRYFRTLSEMAS